MIRSTSYVSCGGNSPSKTMTGSRAISFHISPLMLILWSLSTSTTSFLTLLCLLVGDSKQSFRSLSSTSSIFFRPFFFVGVRWGLLQLPEPTVPSDLIFCWILNHLERYPAIVVVSPWNWWKWSEIKSKSIFKEGFCLRTHYKVSTVSQSWPTKEDY